MTITLSAPLFTSWTGQFVRLSLADTAPGTPLALTLDGEPADFQYTGARNADGAEIMLKLGFAKDQTRILEFVASAEATTCLDRQPVELTGACRIGFPGRELSVGAAAPFQAFAGHRMTSTIGCETAFEGVALARVNDGPLFTDYDVEYRFAENRRYGLRFRCYRNEPWIEVTETFSLGMNAELVWTLNPAKRWTHIISRDSFEGETQPTIEPLGAEHPRDVLGRLQMPVLTEYFIPNNRGWFAFYDARDESAGMIGVLGLYGAKWENPVVSMPEILDRQGTIEWHASLSGGRRHWLLYAGPVEKGYSVRVPGAGEDRREPVPSDPRFVFHRLHAEYNALRLDEHLDLHGAGMCDESCARAPGIFAAGDYHAAARKRLEHYHGLRQVLPSPDAWLQANGGMHLASFRYLLDPTAENARALHGHLIARFAKWVRQFQGYRTGESDYMKNVIGFSRYLRGMLIAYEQLRRDGALSDEQARRLNAYFAFAARRILDEGRWPHSRTWLHPDHPESSRNFYTYGGEHAPDRLVWTNCLPNFQSDPMCALAHLSAIFRDHPDARSWLRFALDDIDRQLDAYCGQSGAWEESINYALYTLSYFVITFKVVKERWGIDYFNDVRARRMVGWLCRFFGPFDRRFGCHTWPAIGNAVLPQNQAEYLLCYAAELSCEDPLRAQCLAVWRLCAAHCRPGEHYPVVMAAMAPGEGAGGVEPVAREAERDGFGLEPLASEVMDEVGVSMRHRHGQSDESYLFQKIGFAKDHYEADESAFNWYAKGTPLCMDYGTYTGDVSVGGAHNRIEIPDEDPLRRGYLADHLFTPAVDYTRCEMPVTLKLLWGRVRTFEEIESAAARVDRTKTPYFYIGDKNPVGPKLWTVRMLLFVKPDYVVLFDRIHGRVPHRFNLHVTGTDIRVTGDACHVSDPVGEHGRVTVTGGGALITAAGRYDLDVLACVQHPSEFEVETGELVPDLRSKISDPAEARKHAQHFVRLYNRQDGMYRTLLFARERGRDVRIEPLAAGGFRVATADYTDEVYLHDQPVTASGFEGRAGWIRRETSGVVRAVVPDGESIAAFGVRIAGRGPWHYQGDDRGAAPLGGPPRRIAVVADGI